MGHWVDRESDSERLPEGFQRIGYDADTQTYSFRAPDGTVYESAESDRYGELYRQGQRPSLSQREIEAHNGQLKKSNRESVKMMLPFALLVLVFLLFMFRFLAGAGSEIHEKHPQIVCAEGAKVAEVEKGESCWAIAQGYSMGVEELLKIEGNEAIDCDALIPGQKVCVPP